MNEDMHNDDELPPEPISSHTEFVAYRILRESVVLTLLLLLKESGPDELSAFFLLFPMACRFLVWAAADAARPIERWELRQGWTGIGARSGARSVDLSSPTLGVTMSKSVAEDVDGEDAQAEVSKMIGVALNSRRPARLTQSPEDETANILR